MFKKFKYVVFDFDGVVCDSTNECMLTAWNAWERFNKRDGFRSSLSEFKYAEMAAFRSLRPYVRGAGEYYILMRATNSINYSINGQIDFDELCRCWKYNLKPFKEVFFKERQRLRNENLDSWIDFHTVYPDVIKVMKSLHAKGKLLIATFKDGESVRLILSKYRLYLSPEQILEQSQISSKLDALDRIVAEKKISKKDLCFIDDNITHLTKPNNNGYKVFLSGWGNTMTEHKEIAFSENISVLEKINCEGF